jgi:hypothetical protein
MDIKIKKEDEILAFVPVIEADMRRLIADLDSLDHMVTYFGQVYNYTVCSKYTAERLQRFIETWGDTQAELYRRQDEFTHLANELSEEGEEDT